MMRPKLLPWLVTPRVPLVWLCHRPKIGRPVAHFRVRSDCEDLAQRYGNCTIAHGRNHFATQGRILFQRKARIAVRIVVERKQGHRNMVTPQIRREIDESDRWKAEYADIFDSDPFQVKSPSCRCLRDRRFMPQRFRQRLRPGVHHLMSGIDANRSLCVEALREFFLPGRSQYAVLEAEHESRWNVLQVIVAPVRRLHGLVRPAVAAQFGQETGRFVFAHVVAEHMAILFLMRVLRGVQRPAHFLRVAAVLTPADHLRDGLPRKRRAAGHVDQPTEQAGAYFSQPRQHRARLRMTDQDHVLHAGIFQVGDQLRGYIVDAESGRIPAALRAATGRVKRMHLAARAARLLVKRRDRVFPDPTTLSAAMQECVVGGTHAKRASTAAISDLSHITSLRFVPPEAASSARNASCLTDKASLFAGSAPSATSRRCIACNGWLSCSRSRARAASTAAPPLSSARSWSMLERGTPYSEVVES